MDDGDGEVIPLSQSFEEGHTFVGPHIKLMGLLVEHIVNVELDTEEQQIKAMHIEAERIEAAHTMAVHIEVERNLAVNILEEDILVVNILELMDIIQEDIVVVAKMNTSLVVEDNIVIKVDISLVDNYLVAFYIIIIQFNLH